MRRSILMAVFLCSTALTPARAEAGPVIPFVAGALGFTAVSATVAASAAYISGAAFASSLFGGIIINTVLSVGLSLLSASLNNPTIPSPADRMVNFAQPVSYAEWVLGRTRKGGPIGFTGFLNSRRYYVPILAAHSIEGIVEHWLDETVVTLDLAKTDQNASNIETGTNPSGYGRINAFLGQPGQVVDAGLDAAFTEITEDHDFASLSGAAIWAKKPSSGSFSTVYPRGRQWVYAPVIDGCDQIYDPRDASTGYSNNAALVLAYWIVNILGREVDWDGVAIEADEADVVVINAELENQPKWTLNGVLNDNQDYEEQRAQMAGACDAFMYENTDGTVGFNLGRWIEPTIKLIPSDFLSLEISEGNSTIGIPTEFAAIYTEPENSWRETPSGAWIEDAESRIVRDEPKIYMISSHNQASRMNKRIAKTKHAQYQLRGTIKMAGYELIGQRFFRVVHPEMGLDEYFEVGELARESPGVFTLSANSVKEVDFDFDASTEEATRPLFNSVASNDDIEDLENITASNSGSGSLTFSWDAADESLTQQIQMRISGDTDWQVTTVPEGQENIKITGLNSSTTYEYQGRNRTASLRAGDWKKDIPDTKTTT